MSLDKIITRTFKKQGIFKAFYSTQKVFKTFVKSVLRMSLIFYENVNFLTTLLLELTK